MSCTTTKIPLREINDTEGLFAAFLSENSPVVTDRIGGSVRSEEGWSRAAGGRERDAGAWAQLNERLAQFNASIGVKRDVIDRLAGGARVIIAGQQPGTLGGPLMTLYKIVTALALSEEAELRLGVPCVPVYWMGGDDVDFAEIREIVVTGSDLAPYAAAIATGAHKVALPVGDIGVDALERVWDSLAPLVATLPGAADITDLLRGALDASQDLGEVCARVIAGLTGGRVMIVDGREPLIRQCAKDLVLEYFDHESEVRDAIETEGAALTDAGFHAQLTLGPDSGVFLLDDGLRQKIPESQRATARAQIAADVGQASPGVVLRSLLQDVVFQPLATVLGPAEIAYRVQMASVYGRFGVQRPVAFPRLFASYVPRSIRDALERGTTQDLVSDPAAFVRSVASSFVDSEVEARIEAFRSMYQKERDALVKSFSGVAAGRAPEKLEKRLADVERRLEQVLASAGEHGRQNAVARWPALAHLADAFRRQGRPQERFLSMLDPVLHEGGSAAETINEAARIHVAGTLDGDMAHIVYCG